MVCIRMIRASIPECTDFSRAGFRFVDGGADLDQFLGAVRVAGEEVDLEAGRGFDIGDFRLAALKFIEDAGFQRLAGVRLAAAVERVDGDFPGASAHRRCDFSVDRITDEL